MWNAINNVEGRIGLACTTVLAVLVSAGKAAGVYKGSGVKGAGIILGATLGWITVATGLVWNTWWINRRGQEGRRDSLVPMKVRGEETMTKFVWEKR